MEVGYVISNRNYLAHLDGLPTARIMDIVASETGAKGVVSALLTNMTEVLLLQESAVSPGQKFMATGEKLTIPVGDFLLGRSINPLGVPIDGKGGLAKSRSSITHEIEREARGIESREFITTQLQTGITLVDNLLPLGKGQRELIIGDSHSGKTGFLIDLIVNMKNSNVICVYGAIGKPGVAIKNLLNALKVNKALSYTVIVAASSTEPTPLIFLTPKTALTVAEYFQSKGRDVLLILDDLGAHAKTYREISLLAGKSPGRESYPGDIFYQQAHLLERAGNFNKSAGGGSITALPVIEISLNDFTGFIPTNLMSITDGHLLFKSNLYNKNQRPAIDIAFSVTRVGRQTQTLVNNLLSRRIRQILAKAEELETLSRFSAELPMETQLILRQKGLIEEVLTQEPLTFITLAIQTILLGLIFTTFMQDKTGVFLKKYKNTLIKAFQTDASLSQISAKVLKIQSDIELIKLLESVGTRLGEICK